MMPELVRRYGEVSSTNDIARDLLREGAPSGTVVQAAAQTRGRGRDGRAWASPPGDLFMSIVLRPRGRPGDVAQLGFVAGIAVAEAVEAMPGAPRTATLKWPNDVLLGGRKIAGILLESEGVRPDGVDGLVVGIGVNVVGVPAATRLPATSLAREGATASAAQLLDEVLRRFAALQDRWERAGFAPIRAAWLARAHGLGGPITARLPRETLDGRFAGLDETGALVLERASGRHLVHAGDVFFPGDAC